MTEPRRIDAVVTGAGGGLGLQMVRALLEDGARVCAVDLKRDRLDSVLAEYPGSLDILQCDLAEPSSVGAIVAAARRHFEGEANCLVNNAGIGRNAYAPDYLRDAPRSWEIDDAHWRKFFAINSLASIRLTNALVPGMLRLGWGRVVCVTTSLDSMLKATTGPYGPSKAAHEAYAASLGAELADTGVTVNVLVPGGPVDTDMVPQTRGLRRDTLLPADVMNAPLLWLASTRSDGVSRKRFRANLWPASAQAQAPVVASAEIAWGSIAAGQMRPLRLNG